MQKNQAVLDFLATRRSRMSKDLSEPGPNRTELREILTIASRVPDHKKLVPWRFLALDSDDLMRFSEAVYERARVLGREERRAQMAAGAYRGKAAAVAVIENRKSDAAIPDHEQTLAVGACCYNLLATCLASGWGAQWLTGWTVEDPALTGPVLGLEEHERIAAMIHIGTATGEVTDRPRPDIDEITTWGLPRGRAPSILAT